MKKKMISAFALILALSAAVRAQEAPLPPPERPPFEQSGKLEKGFDRGRRPPPPPEDFSGDEDDDRDLDDDFDDFDDFARRPPPPPRDGKERRPPPKQRGNVDESTD